MFYKFKPFEFAIGAKVLSPSASTFNFPSLHQATRPF